MTDQQIELTIPSKLAAAVEAAVASGDFASPSEVVAEAVALWLMDRETVEEETDRLRAAVRASLDDPRPDFSVDQVRAHFARRSRSDEAA